MVHRRPRHELCKLFAQTPTRVHVPQLGGVSRNVQGSPPRAWEGFFRVLREKKILVYNNKLRLRVRKAEEVTPDHCSAQTRFRCRGQAAHLEVGCGAMEGGRSKCNSCVALARAGYNSEIRIPEQEYEICM